MTSKEYKGNFLRGGAGNALFLDLVDIYMNIFTLCEFIKP